MKNGIDKRTILYIINLIFNKNYMFSKLFSFYVTTEFLYAPYVFACVVLLFILTYVYDLLVKQQEDSNKLLFKAMKWKVWYYRWGFTTVALIMLVSRLEWIPILNMRFWWIIYWLGFIVYSFYFIEWINQNYKSRIKNKEKFKS